MLEKVRLALISLVTVCRLVGRVATNQMSTKDGNIIIFSDSMGGIEIPFENLVQAVIVLSIGVLIIVTNVIIIATFITAPGKPRSDIMRRQG